MLKSGPNYRMSAQAKRFAALITDPHKRGAFLRSTVQAELVSASQPRREKPRGGPQGE
jgi:hypothetical protein